MTRPPAGNAAFLGTIPAAYEKYLVPLFFERYADDLTARAVALQPAAVLETACGTGVLTVRLRAALPPSTTIAATDISDAMLERAQGRVGNAPSLTWQTADACALPFPDESVDLVVCQFGLMFFPDRVQGLAEARRVLRPGGTCLMNVWDGFAANPIGRLAQENIIEHFPDDPPTFYHLPFSMEDRAATEALFARAGFADIALETLRCEGVSPSARDAALGMVTGTPTLGALYERGVTDPSAIVATLEARYAESGGRAPYRTPLSASVITARK